MMQFYLEDPTGHQSVVFKGLCHVRRKLKPDHIVMITGRLDLRRNEYTLSVDSVSLFL